MTRAQTRRAIRHAGLLLAGLCTFAPALPGLAAPPSALLPALLAPDGAPLVLTRTLTRLLPDGRTIVVRRSYALRVTTEAAGAIVLDGRQIAVTVEAPPLLAALARLERARVDDGLFPIRLDPHGRIVSDRRTPPGDAAGARQETLALLGTADLAAADRAEAERAIERLASGATSDWPADLFAADASDSRSERRVALPDGSFGTVTLEVRRPAPSADRLLDVERIVTTRLGGSERVVRESWTLARQ